MFVHYQIKSIMKNRLSLIIAFLTFFAFTSCEDEPLVGTFIDETGVEGGGITNSFFANVDGVEYVESATTISTIDNGTIEYISIAAVKDGNEIISLAIPIAHVVGNYSFTEFLEASSVSGSYVIGGSALTNFPGTLVITEKTATRISGTFNFTAAPILGGGTTYDVTDGSFSVTY